jgi:hypothetical protein
MAQLKHSIVTLNAETKCLAHALIIAIASLDNDPIYNSYRRSYKIRPKVDCLLQATGVDLSQGGDVPNVQQYYYYRYKIVVYNGLKCDSIMYEGQVDAPKRIKCLFDEKEKHYHVINNLVGAFAKRYLCETCNKSSSSGVTRLCEQVCSDCHQSPHV